ncbi:MAG: hypothetical protein WD510_02925, partial [Balneolaceae bacterium]
MKKWGLIFLRGSAFFVLILLLLNPFLEFTEVEIHQPEIAVYLDDSKSMSVTRGDYRGWESYKEIIESFEFEQFSEVASISFYRFDDVVEPLEKEAGPVPELDLEGGVTHLDEVFRHIRDQSGQARATILLSDGIITRGRDPVYHARELPGPVFTVPVGDTSRIRDIAITEVITNETGYTHTRQPVDATVRQNGFSGETVTALLLMDGEETDSQQISFSTDPSSHTVSFDLMFEETGLHNYEIRIPPLEDEETSANNHFPFSVDVLDDQTRILHIAFEIHPDVRAIRTLLQTDQSLDVETKTWLGDRFVEGSLNESENPDYDLIILHGHPPENLSSIESLISEFPVLQFSTPGVRPENLEVAVIPLEISNPGWMRDLQIRVNPQQENHPILEFDPINFSRVPQLQTREGTYQKPVTANVLLYATIGGSETEVPVLLAEETGNLRHALVNAFGWFKFTQSQTENTRRFVRTLITNLVAWTHTSPDRRNLQISPVHRVFQETEPVRFRASLTNESGEREPDAVIEVVIMHENDTENIYTMRNRGQGNYDLSAGRLVSGNYRYQTRARKDGRTIDEYEGEFSVSESTVEFVNTERNDPLLRQLAEVTGGQFLDAPSSGRLQSELAERNLLNPVEERRTLY